MIFFACHKIPVGEAKKLTCSSISPIIRPLDNNLSSRPNMIILDHLNTSSARYLLFLVCLTLIFYVSLLPSSIVESDIPRPVQTYDIPFHFFVYFILAFTALRAFARKNSSVRNRINLLLVCSLIGALLEIMQATVPGINRSCTAVDFFSNIAGAALAATVIPAKLFVAKTKTLPFRS